MAWMCLYNVGPTAVDSCDRVKTTGWSSHAAPTAATFDVWQPGKPVWLRLAALRDTMRPRHSWNSAAPSASSLQNWFQSLTTSAGLSLVEALSLECSYRWSTAIHSPTLASSSVSDQLLLQWMTKGYSVLANARFFSSSRLQRDTRRRRDAVRQSRNAVPLPAEATMASAEQRGSVELLTRSARDVPPGAATCLVTGRPRREGRTTLRRSPAAPTKATTAARSLARLTRGHTRGQTGAGGPPSHTGTAMKVHPVSCSHGGVRCWLLRAPQARRLTSDGGCRLELHHRLLVAGGQKAP